MDWTSTKHLLNSKTFWFNVIVITVSMSDYFPPKYSLPAAAIGNVILRLMTSQACTVFPTPKPKE